MTPNRFPRRRSLLLTAGAATLLAAAGCDRGASPSGPPPSFKGIDITGAEYARKLSLTDPFGARRSLDEFKGKVVVVFFGYTQCPDVCPTTMVELAQVKKALGPDGDRVQGIFVTVDPERDTAAVLKDYLGAFDPSFVGLRGTLDETKAVAREFKVFFGKVPGRTETSYTVDHTAGSYIFDPSGKVRLFVRYGTGADALAADIRTLLALPA